MCSKDEVRLHTTAQLCSLQHAESPAPPDSDDSFGAA